MKNGHQHFLTFDVEHWYEGYRHRNLGGWENMPPRDHVIVERLFELLSAHNQSATFFFTGRFAREFPTLVKTCTELGHEAASHSDEHRVIYRMESEAEFREDLRKSLDTIEEIVGRPVLGYRAPKWSITIENQHWVFNALADAGLIYDSSFFPTSGCDDARQRGVPLQLALSEGRTLIEIPATGFNLGFATLPVAGGLYFRAFPAWVASAMLVQKERNGARGMLYVHPYDLDVDAPQITGGGFLFRLFRIYGVTKAWEKLDHLLGKHRFTSIEMGLPSLEIESKLAVRAK
jgi:polysaccharide deacetylase family protein (PEP-CTERM system associated)